MKITKNQLMQIIREEIAVITTEQLGMGGERSKRRNTQLAQGKLINRVPKRHDTSTVRSKVGGDAARCIDGQIEYFRGDKGKTTKVPCCTDAEGNFLNKPCPEKGKSYD